MANLCGEVLYEVNSLFVRVQEELVIFVIACIVHLDYGVSQLQQLALHVVDKGVLHRGLVIGCELLETHPHHLIVIEHQCDAVVNNCRFQGARYHHLRFPHVVQVADSNHSVLGTDL